MNSLLIFRFRALSIGSLLFLSSLRARDWKKEKKCGESLFAFAPFWGRSAKKKFYDARRSGKNREKKKRAEMGERSKRFQTTNVFVGRLCEEEEEEENRYLLERIITTREEE